MRGVFGTLEVGGWRCRWVLSLVALGQMVAFRFGEVGLCCVM